MLILELKGLNELCHDGLLHWVNAANNASLFVEERNVNGEYIVYLPIRLNGNSNRISGDSLSPLGDQIKNIPSASQTLLTGVTLPL